MFSPTRLRRNQRPSLPRCCFVTDREVEVSRRALDLANVKRRNQRPSLPRCCFVTDHEVEVSRRALDLANVKRWIPEDHRLNSLAIARQSLKTGILESFVRDRRPHPLEFSARESFLH